MHQFYVITPAFNAEETIVETLRSVLSQTGRFTLHYHVQDGGSTDGTLAILRETAKEVELNPVLYGHVRFSWDSRPDKGMYHAISLAVERLSIPSDMMMLWINADDVLLPGSLQRVWDVVESFPKIRWVGGKPHNTDMDGKLLPAPSTYWHARSIAKNGLCDGEHFSCLQQEGMVWRKSLFDDVGGLDVSLRLAGDWDLWRRMAAFEELVLLPWPTGSFRRRAGQLSEDMAAYRREIFTIAPRHLRRAALRSLWPELKRLPASAIREAPDGGLVCEQILPAWPAKSTLRLFFAAIGWYWVDSLYQKLIKAMRTLSR